MCAGKPEEGVRGSGTEVIDSCGPPYELGTEHSSAYNQLVSLTTELSLHPCISPFYE